ncbi:MAG: hypothetical protein ACWGNV_09855 [Bacteroidales bacterium]
MRRMALLVSGVLIVLASGCEKYIIPPPVIEEGVSYADQVQPIFDDKCVTCHSGSLNPDLRPGESYEFLTTNGYVDTLNPESSKIYEHLQSGAHAGRATDEDKLLILQWIKEGAQNN